MLALSYIHDGLILQVQILLLQLYFYLTECKTTVVPAPWTRRMVVRIHSPRPLGV